MPTKHQQPQPNNNGYMTNTASTDMSMTSRVLKHQKSSQRSKALGKKISTDLIESDDEDEEDKGAFQTSYANFLLAQRSSPKLISSDLSKSQQNLNSGNFTSLNNNVPKIRFDKGTVDTPYTPKTAMKRKKTGFVSPFEQAIVASKNDDLDIINMICRLGPRFKQATLHSKSYLEDEGLPDITTPRDFTNNTHELKKSLQDNIFDNKNFVKKVLKSEDFSSCSDGGELIENKDRKVTKTNSQDFSSYRNSYGNKKINSEQKIITKSKFNKMNKYQDENITSTKSILKSRKNRDLNQSYQKSGSIRSGIGNNVKFSSKKIIISYNPGMVVKIKNNNPFNKMEQQLKQQEEINSRKHQSSNY